MSTQGRAQALPLEGVRVLDFGQLTAGANLSAMLADLGADVIKVESAGYFDLFRYSKATPGTDWWNHSPPFRFTNRNKRSVSIDLKTPAGRDLVFEIMCHCDVVVENFRREVLDRLGLGYDAVKVRNPRIVYASVTSQGETGPNKMHRTYGCTLDAMGGIAALTGYPGTRPAITGGELNYPDQVVSLLASGFVIAALRRVRRSGEGGHLDIAQREIVSFLIGEEIGAASADPQAGGMHLRGNDDGQALLQDCFLASDGRWLAVSVATRAEEAALRRLVGPDGALHNAIAAWAGARACEEAAALMRQAGIAAWPVLDGTDLLRSPETVGGSLVRAADGTLYKGMPYELEGVPFAIARPAPHLGQDTADVLTELLGLSPQEIAALEREGITANRPKEAA